MELLIYIVVTLVVFLIMREVVMWYWKINERILEIGSSSKILKPCVYCSA